MIAPTSTFDAPTTAGVRVLFFGKLADRFGRMRDVDIPPGGCTVGALKPRLAAGIEAGDVLNDADIRTAVDQQLVLNDEVHIRPGQEVAFLPAFSGG
ncbi:MAG: molybdopterin synthase sulfur carrier subunit [Phenylobacterium sp.]|uniref:MoaD/ThiS family protein n=1 Tax=Phenylobacterium sp. TaxID=1871053 RepID=UPI0025FC0EAB|nr:MoaD/ThiS family protein [Phenylobacterium sp.]MBI1197946.1 molybdopterin synthase sulfur carrier subunit [Phenylobacterium sp.]